MLDSSYAQSAATATVIVVAASAIVAASTAAAVVREEDHEKDYNEDKAPVTSTAKICITHKEQLLKRCI